MTGDLLSVGAFPPTLLTLWDRSHGCQGSAPMTSVTVVSRLAADPAANGPRGDGSPAGRRLAETPARDIRSSLMPTIVVDVMPKAELLDPQGKAVAGAFSRLGIEDFTSVRIG